MRFASLGSGSKGNATVIADGTSAVLIDCGFSIKETEKRLARLGLVPADLSAILVTHEHSDHIKGVFPFARRHHTPVYLTAGTARHCPADHTVTIIRDGARFRLGKLTVTPVAVPHDANEPVQFVLESSTGKRLGVLTDLGSVTPHVIDYYSDCDGLVLEANHDLAMLRNGSYPKSLQERVAGAWGHLNNGQSLGFLKQINLARIQQLVVAHISQQNNSMEQVHSSLAEIEQQLTAISYACLNEGFDWLELH